MENLEKKTLLLESLANQAKICRGAKSQYILHLEYGISGSIISSVERAMKDPQFTTLFRLAEAYNMKTWQFVKLVEEELPEYFTMMDW